MLSLFLVNAPFTQLTCHIAGPGAPLLNPCFDMG